MYIVFDIGGTHTRVALSSDSQTIGSPVTFPTPTDFHEGIQAISNAAKALLKGTPATGAAGGLPGPMNATKSKILSAPNMSEWKNKPLKKELEAALKAPVFLENDTAMFGIGEAVHGIGQGKKIVVYITVSTGVGGCRIVDGDIDANALGFEPGHQIIGANGPQCGCKASGHLEAYISGSGLQKQYGKKGEDIHNPDVWDKAALHLAQGLNNVLVFWSPDVIILGGSVMQSIDIEKVRSHMRGIVTIFPTLPPIEASSLGEKGGLLGSLAYLHSSLNTA